jgi:endonuclease YncB( thermonuclease family)
MMKHRLTIALLTLAFVVNGVPDSWADFQARVVTVHEGDKLTILHGGRTEKIFLKDIDCPNLKQPYGKQAKRTTAAYVANRIVTVRGVQRNSKGQTTAEIVLEDGRNIGHELIKEGLAWARKDTAGGKQLAEVEQLIRAEHKGLWSDPNPVPPWKWRLKGKIKR